MTATSRSSALLAVFVALVAFAAVAATMGGVGLTWDEPAYMGSAQAYGDWLTVAGKSLARLDLATPFSSDTLGAYWQHDSTDQHPPVGKFAPAISWRLLRGVLDDMTALRLGNAAIFAALAALVFLLAARLCGTAGGLFAAASFVLMPRQFFHGHLTTLDIPVAFFWMLCVYIYWRWQSAPQRRRWPTLLALGVCYGLALGTKNTSFILPPILLLWTLAFRHNWRSLALLAGMGVVAVPVFVLTWPGLFSDVPGRLVDYVNRMTLGHWDIVQYYLGQTYGRPPWHYPFVIAAAITPLTTLALSLLGLLRVLWAGRADAGGWLIVFNLFGVLGFFGFVSSQVYGSERLFLVAFPYLAILAGMGFDAIVRRLWSATSPDVASNPSRRLESSHSIRQRMAVAAIAVVLLLPGGLGIARMHPHELSYFSTAVGGLHGAERMGLELTYWCETYRAALPFLNAVPERSPSVWTEEEGVLYTYRQWGMLRSDIAVGGRVVKAGPQAATYALIQRRPSGYTPEVEALLREQEPVFVVRQGDVPLAFVFKIAR